jgi:hypothetical protein
MATKFKYKKWSGETMGCGGQGPAHEKKEEEYSIRI